MLGETCKRCAKPAWLFESIWKSLFLAPCRWERNGHLRLHDVLKHIRANFTATHHLYTEVCKILIKWKGVVFLIVSPGYELLWEYISALLDVPLRISTFVLRKKSSSWLRPVNRSWKTTTILAFFQSKSLYSQVKTLSWERSLYKSERVKETIPTIEPFLPTRIHMPR